MSPKDDPHTIIEENSSETEFKVTLPLLIKLLNIAKSELLEIVKLPAFSNIKLSC